MLSLSEVEECVAYAKDILEGTWKYFMRATCFHSLFFKKKSLKLCC